MSKGSMVVASYKSNGVTYSLVQCTASNINSDIEFALQDGVEVDKEEYLERMLESVKQRLAYRVTKSGKRIGIMYNLVEGGEYQGASLYCKEDIIGLMIILKSMFEVYNWHKIKIMPHKEGLKYFVSMATDNSIKKYHTSGEPLVVVRNEIEKHGKKLFNYLGIEAV